MDFLNSRIYEYLKPNPSKSKHLSWEGKRGTDVITLLASRSGRKAAPCYPRQSCGLHIHTHTSSHSDNGLLPPSVAVFRAPTQAGLELHRRQRRCWVSLKNRLTPTPLQRGNGPLSRQVRRRGWEMIAAFHSSAASRAATTLSFHGYPHLPLSYSL